MAINGKDLFPIESTHFEVAVQLIKSLIDKNKIRVAISLPAEVDLVYDSDCVEKEVINQGLEFKQFKKESAEISMMMTAILIKDENSLIQFFINKGKEIAKETEFKEDQAKSLIIQRLDQVKRTLVTDSLTRQLAIKRTSKTNVFSKLAWEVNEKHFDDSGIPPQRLVFASLRLELQKQPFPEIPKALSLLMDTNSQSIVFDVCLEDIDLLEHVLSTIKKRLIMISMDNQQREV